ncbi:MAG: hypothetical protein P8Z35_13000 [Ignavibacteriaceae bacterium]
MKSLTKIFFLVVFLSSFFLTNAQITGVIYSKKEADQKFGPVLNSIEMDVVLLNSLLSRSGNYLLFKINDGNLYILSADRKPLYPADFSVQPKEVYKIVSVSKIKELINQGQNQQIFFEARKNVYSLTNGDFTLEEISDCPPFCN